MFYQCKAEKLNFCVKGTQEGKFNDKMFHT